MTREEATSFFSYVFKGEHHIPGKVRQRDRNEGWEIYVWRGRLSTWDDDYLTRLVLMAHDLHCRVEINAGMNYLNVAVSKRLRQSEDAPICDAHPTMEGVIEKWRKDGWEVLL